MCSVIYFCWCANSSSSFLQKCIRLCVKGGKRRKKHRGKCKLNKNKILTLSETKHCIFIIGGAQWSTDSSKQAPAACALPPWGPKQCFVMTYWLFTIKWWGPYTITWVMLLPRSHICSFFPSFSQNSGKRKTWHGDTDEAGESEQHVDEPAAWNRVEKAFFWTLDWSWTPSAMF